MLLIEVSFQLFFKLINCSHFFQHRCISIFKDKSQTNPVGFALGSIEGRVAIHYIQPQSPWVDRFRSCDFIIFSGSKCYKKKVFRCLFIRFLSQHFYFKLFKNDLKKQNIQKSLIFKVIFLDEGINWTPNHFLSMIGSNLRFVVSF